MNFSFCNFCGQNSFGKSRFILFIILLLLSSVTSVHAQLLLQPGFEQEFIQELTRTRAWGLDVADFDNDGINDIISGETFGDVHLLTGNGDGTFTDQGIVINMSFHNAYGLAAGDFNGDGNQDFVLTFTASSAGFDDGSVLLYLGNGNGTFQSTGFPQAGLFIGDAGQDVMTAAAGDVDDDGDMDLVAGDIINSSSGTADVTLFRNAGNDINGVPIWNAETIIIGEDASFSPDPENPPYFPPLNYLHAYGLDFGDIDDDGDIDLFVTDRASYLYIYENDGAGIFSPIRYGNISTRPFAYNRIHEVFTNQLAIATGDINGDGRTDFATGGADGMWNGKVDVWLNKGADSSGLYQFLNAGIVGSAGIDARGIAIGQMDPDIDDSTDIVFGNKEGSIGNGEIYILFTDLTDTDNDGIVDRFDNAPNDYNPPRLDMNTDGGINYLDQLDNDADGIGDPADNDDDNDGIMDANDNCPFVYNPDQNDFDEDGVGYQCDPLNDTDTDSDGIPDGPIDPYYYQLAKDAKATWAKDDTIFLIRIDALSRVFQNEFTQTFTDAAILTEEDWEAKKFENYNGIGDSPADAGYQIPSDLPGGMDTPLTLVIIPKQIWNAFGDPDPIRWINDRIAYDTLELSQHGTYHNNNTPLGDWADDPNRNFFSCETCGLTLEENYQLLRIGLRTLLGNYLIDPWIVQSGADASSPTIDWTDAANPLLTYTPPFNTSDTTSRDAMSRLLYLGFSASIFEEQSDIFTPEGSHHEEFDQFGMYHASADLQVDPEAPKGMTYVEYLESITQEGGINTWLIEEVEWSTRYCNDLPRLVDCPQAPGGINRENNMVDLDRWVKWLELLTFVNENGQPMTIGDFSLAMSFDNAPTVVNPDQADSNANGIGDVIDGAALQVFDANLECQGDIAQGYLIAKLTNDQNGIADQTVTFMFDSDSNGTPETYTATTDEQGVAMVQVTAQLSLGAQSTFTASWDGILVESSDSANVQVVDTTPPVIVSASVSPDMLWPPNHKMHQVAVSVDANDLCDPDVDCQIVEITSDEPQAGPGNKDNDWTFDELTAMLRAERNGKDEDRIYTLTVQCTDDSGNYSTIDLTVIVPHDQRR